MGSTHLWNSDNPSYWNYGINTSVELRQSFLLELQDQFNDPSFRNYGIEVFTELLTILPFVITGSTQMWKSDNPSYWNYGINTFVELRKSFLLELQDQFNDPSFRNYGI